MAKRNPVARFDIKLLQHLLDRLKFELTRKTGQDNRMSFKTALFVAEGLRQLLFLTRENKKDYNGQMIPTMNLEYISKNQCYNLAGLFLYIIPKLIPLFNFILRKLNQEKDPIRYNQFKELTHHMRKVKDVITDEDYLKNLLIESDIEDSVYDEFGDLKQPKDGYYYKK